MNKKIVLIIVISIISNKINSENIKTVIDNKKQTETTTQTTKENVTEIKHTDLSCEEMDLFNAVLEIKPSSTHQMKKALRIVKNELKKLEQHKENGKFNITEKEVLEYRTNILDSLKPFIIRVLKYEDIIRKIIEKSLKLDFPDSILLKFLDLKDKAKEQDTYFEANIKTAKELELTCLEFIKLLSDIEHNMTQEAKKVYMDAIQKAKNTQPTK
ncbi:MAG: hypothetical protein ABIA74_04245 [bacterium]